MDLPRISPSRLQRTVADCEYPDVPESFEALCESMSETKWAKNLKLSADVVGRLIVAHGTTTKVEIPETVAEEPAAPTISKTATHPPVSGSTKKSAGKGKKYCPGCDEIVGARSAVCKHFGHEFRKAAAAAAPKPDPVEDDLAEEEIPEGSVVETVLSGEIKHRASGIGVQRVHTPAGKCPSKLQGTSLEEIRDWGERVRDTAGPSRVYTFHALKYWIRDFYDMCESWNNPDCDYNIAVRHLTEVYSHEVQ